jgi:alkyl sulfatase BDS1-like metallo-beta-lactamase superfamily hydrolase
MPVTRDDAAERILAGTLEFRDWFLGLKDVELHEVAQDVAYVVSKGIVGNVSLIRTAAGIVMADTGIASHAPRILEELRKWSAAPIHMVVYTHGHWDHVAGLPVYDREAQAAGRPPPQVVAHANVPKRLARYALTAGYNTRINQRQFPGSALTWPPETRAPDVTYDGQLLLTVGGRAIELNHGVGETDDHTWLWVADARLIVSGDFFIWSGPNCGNPQKAQRYAVGWREALQAMLAKRPEVLIPGHGPALFGAARIAGVLQDTVAYLDVLIEGTLARMNRGERLDTILHAVGVPPELAAKPYLRPTYDHPEFVVRNLWRLYGGWYDGNPAHLLPAPEDELARELAQLAGGAGRMAERALALAEQGYLRLAGHLAETAALAAPDNPAVHRARAEVFAQRAAAETSLMARGIFSTAATESAAIAKGGSVTP